MSTRHSPAPPDDNDGHDRDGGRLSRLGRTAYRRGAENPNGSTTVLRADVLAALGVLKVAAADQLQRLLRPGVASNKAIRQALGDLALHSLVASDGNTAARHKTWRLEGAPAPQHLRCAAPNRSRPQGRRRAAAGSEPGQPARGTERLAHLAVAPAVIYAANRTHGYFLTPFLA
ncbi:hypothetical protein GCM10010430_73040 [Kitasatospora cystarginea]|uniref:Uncharacterized protein n=1 Tax=Kitasatospora cystarginea TaxID=58350 RepID=A0ABP5RX00_9ACTN